MLALRGRALLASNVARVALNELQATRQAQAADESAQDWLMLARIDPSNAITIGNLGVAHTNASQGLWDLGRPREAVAKRLENRELRSALAAKSARAAGGLSNSLFFAAVMAADMGNLARAAAYEREWRPLYDQWKQGLAAGSFEAELRSRGEGAFQALFALAHGDIAGARKGAAGAREALLALQTGDDPGRKAAVAQRLRELHAVLAWAEIEAGGFAAAAQHLAWVAEARRSLPTRTLHDRYDAAGETALWALALARSGRTDEARPKAAEALAFQRELQARKPDHQMVKREVVLALLATAHAEPAQAKARVLEAQALFDSLPAEARSLRSSQRVQRLIADARGL